MELTALPSATPDRAKVIKDVTPNRGYIKELDGLRGCAILLVLLCHANLSFGGPFAFTGHFIARIVGRVAGAGWCGVDLFFVLSGFLITRILLDAKGGEGYFRNFYARRVLRIFPLYYGIILSVMFVVPMISRSVAEMFGGVRWLDRASLLLFFYNFRVVATHSPIPLVHVFWSLAVEEHFYLFWPFLVAILTRRQLTIACLVLITGSVLARLIVNHYARWLQVSYLITPCRLDGLAAGSLIAICSKHARAWRILSSAAMPMMFLSVISLAIIAATQHHLFDFIDFRFDRFPLTHDSTMVLNFGIPAFTALFAALVVFAINGAQSRSRFSSLMRSPLLTSIGKYSFGMYVFHSIVIFAISLLTQKFHIGLFKLPPWIGKPVFFLLLLSISYAVAWCSYLVFESRFLMMKRFFEYRPKGRSSV